MIELRISLKVEKRRNGEEGFFVTSLSHARFSAVESDPNTDFSGTRQDLIRFLGITYPLYDHSVQSWPRTTELIRNCGGEAVIEGKLKNIPAIAQ